MKLEKPKSNPTQTIMYGVLILFAGVMIVLVIANSSSKKPALSELTLTATQALAFANQTGTRAPVGGSEATPSAIASSLSSASPGLGTVAPTSPNTALETNLPTSASNQGAPGAGSPPPGVASGSLTQQTLAGSPPSNVTPPSSSPSQSTATEARPPSAVTPPPTLQNAPTEARPPSGGSPPPTLQTTPTEIAPPQGGTPPPTPMPVGAGTYNDTNLAWQYSPGWTTYNGTGPYNNDFHYSETAGNYVDVIFKGTGFTLIYTTNTTHGLTDVYIDGTKVNRIDANGDLSWQSTWTSGTLTNATHIVRFVNASTETDKNVIDVDAITIRP